MSATSALPAWESVGSRSLPAYRITLEEQWRLQVAEIIRLSYEALGGSGDGEPTDGELEVTSHLIAAARQRLAETEAALGRIDDGSYGRCGNCREAISAERLEILPSARYCAACQSPVPNRR